MRHLTNASKVWLRCIVHTNISTNGKKNTFPCIKLSMRNGRCEHRFRARLLVHGKVVVEFGRKVFPVDWLLWKTLNMAKISITERGQVFSCTRLPAYRHWWQYCRQLRKKYKHISYIEMYAFNCNPWRTILGIYPLFFLFNPSLELFTWVLWD